MLEFGGFKTGFSGRNIGGNNWGLEIRGWGRPLIFFSPHREQFGGTFLTYSFFKKDPVFGIQ